MLVPYLYDTVDSLDSPAPEVNVIMESLTALHQRKSHSCLRIIHKTQHFALVKRSRSADDPRPLPDRKLFCMITITNTQTHVCPSSGLLQYGRDQIGCWVFFVERLSLHLDVLDTVNLLATGESKFSTEYSEWLRNVLHNHETVTMVTGQALRQISLDSDYRKL